MLIKLLRLLFDFILLLAVIASYRLWESYVDPFKRGFFCNDESLRYPLKKETYPKIYMWTMCITIPTVVISINELYLHYIQKKFKNKRFIITFLIILYKKILSYLFGLISLNLLLTITKFSVGRLRPHFIDSCKPIHPITGQSLSNCSLLADPYQYIENYVCENKEDWNLRLSFFSGHSSLFAFHFVYTLLYTQYNIKGFSFILIRFTLQIIHLLITSYIIISRYFDYFHHPTDILAGIIIGSLSATATFYFLADYHSSNLEKQLPNCCFDKDFTHYSNNEIFEECNTKKDLPIHDKEKKFKYNYKKPSSSKKHPNETTSLLE